MFGIGPDWVTDAVALFGAITGVGGLWFAHRSVRIAERSASASEESAVAAKAATNIQAEAHRESNTARLQFVPHLSSRHEIHTWIKNGTCSVGFRIANIGKDWAHNVRLSGTLFDNSVESEKPAKSIAPNAQDLLYIRFSVMILPRFFDTRFTLHVHYSDGNGPAHREYVVKIDGMLDEDNFHASFEELP